MSISPEESKILDNPRLKEFSKKYRDGKATDDEIRELFHALGETEVEINLRIDLERGQIPPNVIV